MPLDRGFVCLALYLRFTLPGYMGSKTLEERGEREREKNIPYPIPPSLYVILFA
jgi:hypothetical protein